MASDSYVDVVERLFQEFDWALPLPTIATTVHRCSQQSGRSTNLADLETDARLCLTALTEAQTAQPAGPAPRSASKLRAESELLAP